MAPIPAVLLIAVSLLAQAGLGGGDSDGDGVPDDVDNCPLDPNCAPGLTEIQLLLASDAGVDDDFGISVSLSADGRMALVGAEDAHAAHVFTFDGGTWVEQQILTASGGAGRFGRSVSLSSDGSTALVGAPFSEFAYVFTRSGDVWTEQQELYASDGGSADYFGTAVALSQDGTTALVGAFNAFDGAAYVFTRNGDVWTQQQKLTASDAGDDDHFGWSVALSANGATALVSAPWNSLERGAAYMFVRSGVVWTQRQKLTASDDFFGDQFGWSVALSADGTTALLGAPFNQDAGTDSGSAYVFTNAGLGWAERQKLVASDGASFDRLGYSVSLSSDAATAIVGAYWTAYVYTRDAGTWSEDQELEPDGVTPLDLFGTSVSVSSDGGRVLVGAHHDQTPDVQTGSARVFFSACQLDRDEDGFGDGCDCQPTDPQSYPGALEVCDAIDNDCNDVIDDGFGGEICDGVGECGAGTTECNGAGELQCSTDLGGSQDQSAPEVCDGLDNDCDGETDESDALDQTVWYEDADGDGFGDPGSPALACDAPPGFVEDNTDNCPDTFNPSQADGDGDGIGDACDNCPADANCDPVHVEEQMLAGGSKAVAISADGNTALFRSTVYTRQGNTWVEQLLLTTESGGGAVALSSDGTTALIGAYSENTYTGYVYVFTVSDGGWTQQQKLSASDGTTFDSFGYAVTLSADGMTMLVGAARHSLVNPGAAYVFELVGEEWIEQQRLSAPSPLGDDGFGAAVSLSADGTTALIGAPGHGFTGAAYVFQSTGGTWTLQQMLDEGSDSAVFGSAVSLSPDGTTALVGAPGSATEPSLAQAHVFSSDGGAWSLQQTLARGSFSRFGVSVALSSDGGSLLVGAESGEIQLEPGSVFRYRKEGESWTEAQEITPSDGSYPAEFKFGHAIALADDGTLLVAASQHDTTYSFLRICQNLDQDEDDFGDACDCSVDDPQLWATPGAVSSVSFGPGTTMISWSTPSSPGGLPGTARYDTIRSSAPGDFVTTSVCVESDDASDEQADATVDPAPGEVHFYLVRPENECGEGPLGHATSGPRPPAPGCEP